MHDSLHTLNIMNTRCKFQTFWSDTKVLYSYLRIVRWNSIFHRWVSDYIKSQSLLPVTWKRLGRASDYFEVGIQYVCVWIKKFQFVSQNTPTRIHLHEHVVTQSFQKNLAHFFAGCHVWPVCPKWHDLFIALCELLYVVVCEEYVKSAYYAIIKTWQMTCKHPLNTQFLLNRHTICSFWVQNWLQHSSLWNNAIHIFGAVNRPCENHTPSLFFQGELICSPHHMGLFHTHLWLLGLNAHFKAVCNSNHQVLLPMKLRLEECTWVLSFDIEYKDAVPWHHSWIELWHIM